MAYNNTYISGDYIPDPMEIEKASEIWMPKGTSIHPVYSSDEAKKARYPRSEFLTPPITLESAKKKNRLILDLFARYANFEKTSKKCFAKQVLQGPHDNLFKQIKKVLPYTTTTLPFAKNLLDEVEEDSNSMLSINLSPEMGLICVDIDNNISTDTVDTNLDYEKIFEPEGIILNAAQHTNFLTGESSFSKTKPIIIQTPRGLHMWYRVNFEAPDTPKALKGSKSKRDSILRCGLKAELIASGYCVITGLNYRVLCAPTETENLAFLPPCFYPSSTEAKVKPIEVIPPIKIGTRWNTLNAMVASRQLITTNTLLLSFVHEYLCEEELYPSEVDIISKNIEREISKEKGGKRATKAATENLALTISSSSPIYDIIQMSQTKVGKSYDFVNLLKKILNHPLFYVEQSAHFVRPLMSILAIKTDWRPLACLYIIAYQTTPGLGRALQFWLSTEAKLLAYTNETGWMLYDKYEGIWGPVSEDAVMNWIRLLITNVPQITSAITVPFLKSVLVELESYIKEDIWVQPVTTHAYKDGLVALGYPNLIQPNPAFKTRLFIDADWKDSSTFSTTTEKYLTNLVGGSPAGLILLRLFLFRALFEIGTPSHFLYFKGPPGTGKSVFEEFLKCMFGEKGVFSISSYMMNSNFPFEGSDTRNKFWILPDADKATVSEKLLSIMKNLSTSGSIVVQEKYKEAKLITGVSSIVICNEYLPNNSTPGPMLRRALIINPLPVPVSEKNTGLLKELIKNIGAFSNWISSTPHYLFKLLNYSHCLNCLSKDWRIDSVSSFLQDNIKYFTIGKDLSIPLRTVSNIISEDYQDEIGVYDLYLDWCSTSGITHPCELEIFKTVISEYSFNVFFLPTHPTSNDIFFDRARNKIRSGTTYTTKCWYGVGYKYGEGDPMQILIPIEVAAAILIDPYMADAPFWPSNEGIKYIPSLKVNMPLPEELIVALFDWVKSDIDQGLINQTLSNRIKINDILKSLKEKTINMDKYVGIDSDQMFDRILKTILQEETTLVDMLDITEVEPSPQENITFDENSPAYRGPIFVPPDKVLRLDKFEEEEQNYKDEPVLGDDLFTTKGFYSYILKDIRKAKLPSISETKEVEAEDKISSGEYKQERTFITKELLLSLLELRSYCQQNEYTDYIVNKNSDIYEIGYANAFMSSKNKNT